MSAVDPTTDVRHAAVPDYPGYWIGDDGSAWSQKTNQGTIDPARWKRLKPIVKRGYSKVTLSIGGKSREFHLHRLVLLAFVGPCPGGMEACHGPDFNRLNCHLTNLRWDTRRSNTRDRDQAGRTARGSRVGNSRLMEDDIPRIRSLHLEGKNAPWIAREYRVATRTIVLVLSGETWKHVPCSTCSAPSPPSDAPA